MQTETITVKDSHAGDVEHVKQWLDRPVFRGLEMMDCRKVGLNLIRLCTQPDDYVYCTCSDRDRRREFGVDCPIHSYKITA